MELTMGPQLNLFFSTIEITYETSIQDPVGLSEVFSFYVQYRAQCLEFAAVYNIAPERALHFIQNKLPMLHNYFETDIKRLMQNRLMYFMTTYKLDFSQSHYCSRYPTKSPVQASWMAGQDTNKLFRGFCAENLNRMKWILGSTGTLHPVTASTSPASEQADFVMGWRQHFTL
jgi:hypothetical protein